MPGHNPIREKERPPSAPAPHTGVPYTGHCAALSDGDLFRSPLCPFNLARTETAGAYINRLVGSVHDRFDPADVGLPTSVGLAVRVGYSIAENNTLSAYAALCHVSEHLLPLHLTAALLLWILRKRLIRRLLAPLDKFALVIISYLSPNCNTKLKFFIFSLCVVNRCDPFGGKK